MPPGVAWVFTPSLRGWGIEKGPLLAKWPFPNVWWSWGDLNPRIKQLYQLNYKDFLF
jgi:hypothetical protein